MLNKILKIALFLLPIAAFSETISVNQFKYLNNNESSLIIEPNEAQDLLNVDITPGGKSVKKRSGYGVYKALSTGQAMHGGYHFFDSTGNDVQVWGSSTSLYGIVADATPTQLVSSATLNSTWDCTDTQGYAYCVTSNRNMYLKTDGATKTWYSSPLGTMVEALPDRIAVSGVSGTPNTIYLSGSGDYTNFTTGINTTSPFTEVIASQGSKITHIRWACGKLLWWKDQSFGYLNGDDQFNTENKVVSDNIGTFDNTSALDPSGAVWFRGQDGHIWKYDCSALTKESIDITPFIQASTKRVSNSWAQTSQSDFAAGAVSSNPPSLAISTAITSGSVVPSSFSVTDTDVTTFGTGTVVNAIVNSTNVQISTNSSGNITNNDFETGSVASAPSNFDGTSPTVQTSIAASGCTINPQSGSKFVSQSTGFGTKFTGAKVFLTNPSDGSVLDSQTFNCNTSCSGWTQGTFTSASNARKRAKIAFGFKDVSPSSITTNSTYVFGGSFTFYYRCDDKDAINNYVSFDNVQGGSSTITSGSYTSKAFDTSFTTSVAVGLASWTVSGSTPTFSILTATSTLGVWNSVATSSNTNAQVNRYIKYVASFTISGTQDANTTLDDVTVAAASSGTYYSAVKNAPNLTGWSTFGANGSNPSGSQTFYMRSSTNSFSVLSSTPAWTSQSNGGLVSIATGTYFQIRDDFAVVSATSTPNLTDFTVNWFEGSASDQAYSIYFDNSVWWSVAYGAGQSTNNYIFKNDLINDGWTVYNFGTGGFAVQNNRLYFGDTSAGNVFNYGTQNSDNGTSINAYWKSKDFAGQDPWLENQYKQLDSYFTKLDNATATMAYSLNTSTTSTSYSVSLSSTTQTMIANKKLLPFGKYGNTFNLKVSDTSTTGQWEFLGFRILFDPQPYRPSN